MTTTGQRTIPACDGSQTPWKPLRRRRVPLIPVIIYLFYVFKNMPTDVPPARDRLKSKLPPTKHVIPDAPLPPGLTQSETPLRTESDINDKDELCYDGKLRFYELASTLKLFLGDGGKSPSSVTVFAAASLGSVSDLLPLACCMANARVDYGRWSTDGRMEQAVAAVLPYVRAYLRPQILITQGETFEDQFFLRAVRTAQDHGMAYIALPRVARDLIWMAALGSHALQKPESAGSAIRLIKSLAQADFLGFSPGLTIELPSHVDPELLRFLEEMKRPSGMFSKISVRRRIQSHQMSPGEPSLCAVEAFYPQDPTLSHVLVLSPNVELAPSFFLYLMYDILLMGISLELPSSRLTDIEPFKQPNTEDIQFRPTPSTHLGHCPYKWLELHSFLRHRLAPVADAETKSSVEEKIIPRIYPAFMGYLLELIRARGYYLLYPAFYNNGSFLSRLSTVNCSSYQGNFLRALQISDSVLIQEMEQYRRQFRLHLGGCQGPENDGVARELFCAE
ncbi:hypothetical protein BDW68DRAFT_187807 [Aspergillus falconensis]